MAVATSKRTQTNFDVNAVWQYLTWKNVVCEDGYWRMWKDVPCAFVALDDGRWSDFYRATLCVARSLGS